MAIANTTIARPYAKAVFELALQQHKLAECSAMLQLLANITQDPQMVGLINHPGIDAHQLVDLILSIGGKYLNEDGKNLLSVLAANKRLSVLPEISMLFELLRAEQEQTINAEVITAMPLNGEQQQKIIASLSRRLKREISLNITLDKSILGGAIIRAGDLVIDGSLRSKLNRLSSTIAA